MTTVGSTWWPMGWVDAVAGNAQSHMAVELLANHPALIGNENASSETIRHALRQAFLDVSQEIHSTANLDAQLYGMGTTAVLTLIVGNRLYIASLGDSRAYLLRDGDLHQYTVDHNMAQTLVNLGVISASRRPRTPVAEHAVEVLGGREPLGRSGRERGASGTRRSCGTGH